MELAAEARSCTICDASLAGADSRRRYCSDRCRQAAHRRRRAPVLHLVSLPELDPDETLTDDEAVEAELLALMLEHAKRNWQACRWLLQVRFPRHWGPA